MLRRVLADAARNRALRSRRQGPVQPTVVAGHDSDAYASVADYGICLLGTDGSMQCYGTNTYGFQVLNTIGALPIPWPISFRASG
jgi:hypothetical protein